MNLPFVFTLTDITPVMFANLKTHLKSSEVKAYQETTPSSGHVSTSEVDFDYGYDGTDAVALQVTSINTWLLRRIATPDLIKSHASAQIKEWDFLPLSDTAMAG